MCFDRADSNFADPNVLLAEGFADEIACPIVSLVITISRENFVTIVIMS